MNEFVAKKLGEVLAFAVVGKETFEKGKNALSSVLTPKVVEDMISNFSMHVEIIQKIAREEKVEGIVNKKLEGTGEKLRKMRDLYVGDQWDNSTELLEWSGFFEGAAIVHWSLVKGANETIKDSGLTKLAQDCMTLHEEILKKVSYLLHETGKNKAKN